MTSVAAAVSHATRPPFARTLTWLLVAAVVAVEVPYPLAHGHTRDALTVATVVVFAAASLVHATRRFGPRYASALVVVAGGGGFAAEAIGVHSGVPFGDYRYTGGLGPSLLAVPLVVPLAWVMMAHPALVVARRVARTTAARIVVATVALASWDVFLDPQMVAAGHWRWDDPAPHLPGVADVPLSNFGGWLLVAALMTATLAPAAGRSGGRDTVDGDAPAIALWMWTWLSSTLAFAVFLHRPAVAAWGFVAMATVGLPLLARLTRRPSTVAAGPPT